MRPSDQGIGADADPERGTAAPANVGASQRAVMQAIGGSEHPPSHDTARLYAKIEAQAVDMAHIVFRRSGIVATKAASELLMRADDKAETGGGVAGENAPLCASCLLCSPWSHCSHKYGGRQKYYAIFRHDQAPRFWDCSRQSAILQPSPQAYRQTCTPFTQT